MDRFTIIWAALGGLVGIFIVSLIILAVLVEDGPIFSAAAKVVAKRANVSGALSGDVHTTNYITFQDAAGNRVELRVPNSEFGLLVEGDSGTLNTQGGLFYSFERQNR